MTREDWFEVGKQLAEETKKVLQPMKELIADLDRRVKQLESQPRGLKYCGTWERGCTYDHGDTVTHHGSLWICKVAPAASEPSIDPVCWQLACKRGRDGRDGRDAR